MSKLSNDELSDGLRDLKKKTVDDLERGSLVIDNAGDELYYGPYSGPNPGGYIENIPLPPSLSEDPPDMSDSNAYSAAVEEEERMGWILCSVDLMLCNYKKFRCSLNFRLGVDIDEPKIVTYLMHVGCWVRAMIPTVDRAVFEVDSKEIVFEALPELEKAWAFFFLLSHKPHTLFNVLIDFIENLTIEDTKPIEGWELNS